MAYEDALRRLKSSLPGGVPRDRWQQACDDAEDFVSRWGEQAERLGWTELDLFDLHEEVPLSRFDRMGAVWLIKGAEVVGLDERFMRIGRQTVERRSRMEPEASRPGARRELRS